MNDAFRVEQLERREHLLDDASGITRRQPALGRLHELGKRLRFVAVHDEIDRAIRIDDCPHAHEVRVRDLGEYRTFERKPVERAEEIPLAISRVGPDRDAVGAAGNEAARKEFLDDDGVAIHEVFRVIAEREWARSASGTNHTKAIDEQCSWTERKRVLRILGDYGHTNSGGEVPKVIAQRMPV